MRFISSMFNQNEKDIQPRLSVQTSVKQLGPSRLSLERTRYGCQSRLCRRARFLLGSPTRLLEYSSVFHDRSCRKRWAINASLPIGLSIPRSLNAKGSLPVLLHDGSMTAWSQTAVDGVLAMPPPFAGNPKTTPGYQERRADKWSLPINVFKTPRP